MRKQSKQAAVRSGGSSESTRHRRAVAAGLVLFVVMAAGLVYAANALLGPVQAEAQGAACVPSWAKACASVEVGVDGDNLLIHVPKGSLPKVTRSRWGREAALPDTVRKTAGANVVVTQAPEAKAPASIARTPAPQARELERLGASAAGLAVYASANGNLCVSADTPGCVDVTEQWLAAASDTTTAREDDDDDPCVDDEDDEAADADEEEGALDANASGSSASRSNDPRSLEQRAVAEEDSTDVDPCAFVLLGGGGSLLNPLTFLVPIPIVIGILAGGDDDGPPTGQEQGGLDDGPGDDGTGDGVGGDGGSGNNDGGNDDGGNDDGPLDDGPLDDGGNDDGGNDDGGNDDGGNDDGGNDDGPFDDFPPDDDETPPMSEVPEPISTTLFGIGLLGWAGARARQRRRESALDPDELEDPLD